MTRSPLALACRRRPPADPAPGPPGRRPALGVLASGQAPSRRRRAGFWSRAPSRAPRSRARWARARCCSSPTRAARPRWSGSTWRPSRALMPWQLAILEPGREPRRLGGKLTVKPARLSRPAPDAADRDGGSGPGDGATRGVGGRAAAHALPDDHARAPLARALRPPGRRSGARQRVRLPPRSSTASRARRTPASTSRRRAARRWWPPTAAASRCVGDYFFPGRLVALDHGLGPLHALLPPRHGGGRPTASGWSAARRSAPWAPPAARPVRTCTSASRSAVARVDPAALLGLDVPTDVAPPPARPRARERVESRGVRAPAPDSTTP